MQDESGQARTGPAGQETECGGSKELEWAHVGSSMASHGCGSKPCTLVHIKIGGKWMFLHPKWSHRLCPNGFTSQSKPPKGCLNVELFCESASASAFHALARELTHLREASASGSQPSPHPTSQTKQRKKRHETKDETSWFRMAGSFP